MTEMNDSGTGNSPGGVPALAGRLLIPVDFSASGRPAALAGLDLARQFGARVTFLHVLPPVTGDGEIVDDWDELLAGRRERAVAALERWRGELDGGREAAVEVLEGKPFEEIVRFAAANRIDLIVMARAGEPGLIRQLLGTTAERVLHHAPCSVLVVGDGERATGAGADPKLMLTTDFSDGSLTAFPWAEGLARAWGAAITLANVGVPLGLFGTVEYERHQEQIDALREAAARRLAAYRDRHLDRALRVETVVVEGTTYRALCRLARHLEASLIVIGSRGMSNWRRVLIGSTAEGVVRHAPCPVLVVRGSRGPRNGEGPHAIPG